MKKTTVLVAVLALALAALMMAWIGCTPIVQGPEQVDGEPDPEPSELVGAWQIDGTFQFYVDGSGTTVGYDIEATMQLYPNLATELEGTIDTPAQVAPATQEGFGTYVVDEEAGTIELTYTRMLIDGAGGPFGPVEYEYQIIGNELKLTSTAGVVANAPAEPLVYTRLEGVTGKATFTFRITGADDVNGSYVAFIVLVEDGDWNDPADLVAESPRTPAEPTIADGMVLTVGVDPEDGDPADGSLVDFTVGERYDCMGFIDANPTGLPDNGDYTFGPATIEMAAAGTMLDLYFPTDCVPYVPPAP